MLGINSMLNNKIIKEDAMKTLTIQVEDTLYDALLEILENLPKHKIKIQEMDSDNRLDFEQAMDYALDKNEELYKRLS
jgi:hypothetical protein